MTKLGGEIISRFHRAGTSATPATAEKFWRLLKGNLKDVRTANRNGSRVDFPDLSVAVYRRITSTKGSPGVTLTIKTSGLGVTGYQRIHFIKKSADK